MVDYLEWQSRVKSFARKWFEQNDFFEVETSILSSYSSLEKYIFPLETKITDDRGVVTPTYLRVSPELAIKKLLAKGQCKKVFEFAKCFRNHEDGLSREHLNEFTLLEWYERESNLAILIERFVLLIDFLMEQFGQEKEKVDWRKITVKHAFREYGGIDFDQLVRWEELHQAIIFEISKMSERPKGMDDWSLDDVFYWFFLNQIEPHLKKRPTLLYEYPEFQASFSRCISDHTNKKYGLRFEAYLGGMELANGFEELCEVKEQEKRWQENQAWFAKQGKSYEMDLAFLDALKQLAQFNQQDQGSLVGVAVGWERLLMVLAKEATIQSFKRF